MIFINEGMHCFAFRLSKNLNQRSRRICMQVNIDSHENHQVIQGKNDVISIGQKFLNKQ